MTALASSVHLDHILFPFEPRRFPRGMRNYLYPSAGISVPLQFRAKPFSFRPAITSCCSGAKSSLGLQCYTQPFLPSPMPSSSSTRWFPLLLSPQYLRNKAQSTGSTVLGHSFMYHDLVQRLWGLHCSNVCHIYAERAEQFLSHLPLEATERSQYPILLKDQGHSIPAATSETRILPSCFLYVFTQVHSIYLGSPQLLVAWRYWCLLFFDMIKSST